MSRHLTSAISILILVAGSFPGLALAQSTAAMNNAQVIKMTKLGLGDAVIIARIKTSTDTFKLSDSDLVELKQEHVSDRVVAAMLEASSLHVAEASIGDHALKLETLGESKVGGRIGHELTFGFRSVKMKAYLPGKSALVTVTQDASILLTLPLGDTPANYLVVRMDQKSDRREIEVASGGGTVGEKAGIRDEAIQRVNISPTAPNSFQLTPTKPLKPGQYFIYIIGSADTIHSVWGKGFAFAVAKTEH